MTKNIAMSHIRKLNLHCCINRVWLIEMSWFHVPGYTDHLNKNFVKMEFHNYYKGRFLKYKLFTQFFKIQLYYFPLCCIKKMKADGMRVAEIIKK